MTRLISTLAVCFVFAGCVKNSQPPVYITSEAPELPEQCFPQQVPAIPEPKLKPNQDATDIDAVRDREAWKRAYRVEKSYRSTCAQRLNVLFPSKEKSKPTS